MALNRNEKYVKLCLSDCIRLGSWQNISAGRVVLSHQLIIKDVVIENGGAHGLVRKAYPVSLARYAAGAILPTRSPGCRQSAHCRLIGPRWAAHRQSL